VAEGDRGDRGERLGPPRAASNANPAWPVGYVAGAGADRLMQPWVWTLIGLALFVAFFLVGYLIFPHVKFF
jgi:hypothetical protein